MQAAPQKVVNRAAAPAARPASSPAAASLRSPKGRIAASIAQREAPIRAKPSEGGNRTYQTRDGRLVQLPPDVTVEEAAALEAEALAAQKKLGKGPPPKPVPDVKRLAKKEAKKEPTRPRARGTALARAKRMAAPKAVAAAAALMQAAGKSKVAQYLAAQGAPALVRGISGLQRLRQNEQTHDDAAEKLTQSEHAVVIPASEGQSKSNVGQVNTVSERPAPHVDERAAKQTLQATLAENTPQTIEDLDNFKRDIKAQHMSASVLLVVLNDKIAVTSTFGDLRQTPPAAPREHPPQSFPPEEIAPPTPLLNVGRGTISPLKQEHTDASNFTQEADRKLQEEGVTQEQLDMVDRGELAEANREKKGLEKAARTEPATVQEFARQEATMVDKELQQEETKGRDEMRAKRKAGLGATARKQRNTKTTLEKKREEVAAKINGIYQRAQDSVTKKLADLETNSLKRFDDGSAKAAKAFEDNVNRELDAYKDERYSGWFGWARKAKDWLLGMDELPGVKAIFDRNRGAFVNTINKLVEDITADNKRVIQECKDELVRAKKDIQKYVDSLGPKLKGIGRDAAKEMDDRLHELDRLVGQKEQELQTKLKDKQTAAIKAIDQKVEKMKEAMSGALVKLGKLLLYAAKKFFTWALSKFGYSLEQIEGIINKGAAVLKAIFTQPIRFVKNLVNAASTGFRNFAKNFLTHLKNAIFDWLTGSLEGIQIPSSWDLKGIASVALQMLGLTWSNIRSKLVKLLGETPVKAMEAGFDLVMTLVKEGPLAAWEKLKEMADDIKTTFIEAVKDFIKIKIVQKAIETILSLFIPGAGIIRAIVAIYDTVVFFIQKAKQIAEMVGNFLGSIGEIAMGNIGAAADALEKGLATALKLVINFLAKFLRLDGITAKIRAAIQNLRAKVDKMLDRVVEWIVNMARRLGRFVAQAGVPQDPNERLRLGLDAATAAINALRGSVVTESLINPVLAAIKVRYGFQTLQPIESDGDWWVEAVVNPRLKKKTKKRTPAKKKTTLAVGQQDLEALVKPRPPVTYPVDALSRANGPFGYVAAVKAGEGRDSTTSKFMPGYQPLDQKGHLIGDRFHGPGEAKNLVPMAPKLNLSDYKKHENKIAAEFLKLVNANRPVLLKMEAKPTYPYDDPINNASYRPTSVRLVGDVYTLQLGLPQAVIEHQTLDSGSLPNPPATVTSIQVNGDVDELKAALWILARPRISDPRHVHKLVKAVLEAREEANFSEVDGFRLRVALVLGDFAHLVGAVHDSEIKF